MNAEKPFDFATTQGKLPKQILPTEYAVRIVPKIEQFIFTGTETVKLNVRAPVRQIVLNALELEISSERSRFVLCALPGAGQRRKKNDAGHAIRADRRPPLFPLLG